MTGRTEVWVAEERIGAREATGGFECAGCRGYYPKHEAVAVCVDHRAAVCSLACLDAHQAHEHAVQQ